jgi:hypothetical protein
MSAYSRRDGLTAEQYRKMSDDAHQRKIESFERCDTDGFLSQFALDAMSSVYRAAADLVEQDWKDCWETLADMDGNLVPCREIETKYGMAYGVYASFEDAQNYGEIIKWVGRGARAAKNKGYQIVVVRSEAKVEMAGGYTAHAVVLPVHQVFTPENCEIVK